MIRGSVVGRIWQLVTLLDSPRGRTLSELRDKLGCSLRTVMRDLQGLQTAGVPIYDERDGKEKRWKFVEGFKTRVPVPFSLTELMALYFARTLCRPLEPTPIYQSLQEAFKKIALLLPPTSIAFLKQLDGIVEAHPGPFKDYRRFRRLIDTVTRARLEHRSLDIVYDSFARQQITNRRIDPYRLWYFQGGLYVAAHDHLRGEVRIFALERMKKAFLTRRKFSPPENFDFGAYMESALGVFRGPPIEVRIKFTPRLAPYILERQWHPTQRLEKRRDGGVLLTLEVADTLELRRWILSFGADGEVLEPTSLRREIRDEAQALLDRLERWDLPPNQLFLPVTEWPVRAEVRAQA